MGNRLLPALTMVVFGIAGMACQAGPVAEKNAEVKKEIRTIYVSLRGDDSWSGNLPEANRDRTDGPVRTIQKAVNLMRPGDICLIRGGTYHEQIRIAGLNGSKEAPCILASYKDELVVLDGTIPIQTKWERYRGNIYKAKIKEDVWQLFADGRLQVIARWPNASTNPTEPFALAPGSQFEAAAGTWWSKETTWAKMDGEQTKNGIVDNNPKVRDLTATGLSFQGGSVILSVLRQGGEGNQERLITEHRSGSNILRHPEIVVPKPEKGYQGYDKWFIIEHLNALDQAGEWYFQPADKTLYIWPEQNQNPERLAFRGRTIGQALTVDNCSHLQIRGLNFFACNFVINGSNILVEDCRLSYPDASRRILGKYAEAQESAEYATRLNGPDNSLVNCVIEYSEGSALLLGDAEGSILHNNLFHHIGMYGLGRNGAIEHVHTYTRNTLHTCGTRSAVKTNAGPAEGRNQTYNLFKWIGYLQVADGAALQCAPRFVDRTVRAHNWFLYFPKYGSRWDGKPSGTGGILHHNVGVNNVGSLMVKGDDQKTFNNTCLNNCIKQDIIVVADSRYGGNANSHTWNNLADRMAGERMGTLGKHPIPGQHSHNWNGYVTGTDADLQLMDPANLDFRPRPGADIVDAGKIVAGFSDTYKGKAPDIGAYEYGDENYWIPGRQTKDASSPIPLDHGVTPYARVDLMWLAGYRSERSDVYFGASEESVGKATKESAEFKGTRTNNIFSPGPLEQGKTYYWRIDAVGQEVVKGQVWCFKVERPTANP